MRDRQHKGHGEKVVQRVAAMSTPGKHTLTEQLPVPFVARSAAAAPPAAPAAESNIQEIASRGTQSASGPLPYLDLIQRSFGRHDVSGVQAHVGGAAAEAADQMGALAYATGNHVAFGETPSLHTAAHEAAHIVQQRAGVHLKGGVDEAGDAYERNADEVADRVVAGRSAEDLLPPTAGSSSDANVQQSAVQRYAKVAGQPYDRLSDDGKLAVIDHGMVGWAETSMIASSNAVLDAKHSKVKIETVGSGDVAVASPGARADAPKTTLKQFRIIDRATSAEAQLTDDCGAANQQVLGAEHHGHKEFVAANKNGTTQEFTGKEGYHRDDNKPGGIVSTTEVLSGQIYVRIFEREFKQKLTREDALKAWAALDTEEQERLSKKYGINKHAVPKVGQGVTIGSERDMPGAVRGGYNFHFAFNLMMSGNDYITVEDYAKSGVKYYLDMYGPESKGQSFAQDPDNVGALGNKTTTMVVDHPGALVGTVNDSGAQLVDIPEKWDNPRTLTKGDKVTITRKGINWMRVTVSSGKQSGQVGWILNKYFTQS